jgi:hypothetical protein
MYLSASTKALLDQNSDRKRGRTHDVVILMAVSRNAARLAEHFQGLQPDLGEFAEPTRRRRQQHDEPQVAIGPRLTERQAERLDQMWRDEAGAPTRGAYVDLALRLEYGSTRPDGA